VILANKVLSKKLTLRGGHFHRQGGPGGQARHRPGRRRRAACPFLLHFYPLGEQVVIIDEDLGLSGSGIDKRSGFARLTSEVALTHVVGSGPTAGDANPNFCSTRCNRAPGTPCPKGEVKEK
jgi:hypothetical protein